MKVIQLTRGKGAIVDDDDFLALSRFSWHARVLRGDHWYAGRSGLRPLGEVDAFKRPKTILMHIQILGFPSSMCDHIDGNGLNNQRANLRICTNTENSRNRRKKQTGTASKYKGVQWNKKCRKWEARVKCDGRIFYAGWFDREIDAAIAYDRKAKELFGQFACPNLPEPPP